MHISWTRGFFVVADLFFFDILFLSKSFQRSKLIHVKYRLLMAVFD